MKKLICVLVCLAVSFGSVYAADTIKISIGIGANAQYSFVTKSESVNFGKSISPVLTASLENVSGTFLPLRLSFLYRMSKLTFWDSDTNATMAGSLVLRLFGSDTLGFYIGGGILTDTYVQKERGPKKVFGTINAALDIDFSEVMGLRIYTLIPANQISAAIDRRRGKEVSDIDSIPNCFCGAMLVFNLN